MQRVLIVDDDPFILEGIKRVVGRDFSIETADSGTEGLYKLQECGPFATVVSDINMRGMSGIEFLEQARAISPLTTRVVMTGYADQDTLSASINRASVYRFLHKPVSRSDFANCLTESGRAYDAAVASQSGSVAQSIDPIWIQKALTTADFEQQMSLKFQPRVASMTGVALGVEALVRWHHPERGAISPVDFIPVAETGPAIRDLTNWVLLRACRTWTEWQYRRGISLSVSVNISPALFSDPGLVGMVRNTISRSGIDPRYLELEITEGLELQDHQTVFDAIAGLRSLGVKLSIDDFGTGFASMSYLQALDVDCVKIDRSFVTHAPDNSKDQAILRAVHELGQSLGLKTVAEGIENHRHEAFIRDIGIDEMQGFLYAKPLTSGELMTWIGERQQLLPTAAPVTLLTDTGGTSHE